MKNDNQPHTADLIRISSIIDMPSAIEDIFNLKNEKILAVGRSDNSIEIWSTNTWVQLLKIPGLKGNEIKKVFMIKTAKSDYPLTYLRLFTISLNGSLIEWCLNKLTPKNYYTNPAGGIWDFDLTKDNQYCLLGCDEGNPRLIKLDENDLYMTKQYSKTNAKILSINYEHPNQEHFYTGLSNGYIIKWNSKTGEQVLNFNIVSTSLEKNKKIADNYIWAVKSINEKYLASGDSFGTLKIWDAKFGVLLKEIKEHIADITTIEINYDYETLYFSGADSLICAVQLQDGEFSLTSKYRGQSHDIAKLCLLNNNYLLSGGLTTDICIYRLQNSNLIEKYDKKVNTAVKRHISAFEHKSKIYIGQSENKENFFILHRKINCLELWLVNANNEEKSILLARINKNEDSNINCANISSKGNFLAYSDADNTCLFKYNLQENTLKKLKTFKNTSARFLFFSSDEKKLIIVNQINSKIMVYNISNQTFLNIDFYLEKSDVILACDYFHKILDTQDTYVQEKSTTNINTSSKKNSTSKKALMRENNSNSKEKSKEYLCFSTVNKNIYFFNLDENNNFVNGNVPNPDCLVTQIKFRDENNLIISCEDNKFYIINYEIYCGLQKETYDKIVDINFKFDDWTEKNLSKFPINYKKWFNKIMGISVNQKFGKNLILLYTDYNYIFVNLDKEIPKLSAVERIKEEKMRHSDWNKSLKIYHKNIYDINYQNIHNDKGDYKAFQNNENNNDKEANDNFKIVSRFSSILYLNVFDNPYDENKTLLFVVENDWNKITKNFREAVAKSNYAN